MSESTGDEGLSQVPAAGDDSQLSRFFASCRPELSLDQRTALILGEDITGPGGLPGDTDWHVRIGCVLETIYNVFVQGYREEAICLGRRLCDLVIDGEAQGLLALMLLEAGLDEGKAVLAEALAAPSVGPYTIQAAIADLQSRAPVDRAQIAGLCDLLMNMAPSPAIAAAIEKISNPMSNPPAS